MEPASLRMQGRKRQSIQKATHMAYEWGPDVNSYGRHRESGVGQRVVCSRATKTR